MPKKKPITILDVDWWKEVNRQVKPKYIDHIDLDYDKLTVKVDFTDEVAKKFGSQSKGENDDLDTKVSEGGRKVYQDFLKKVVAHVKAADEDLAKIKKDYEQNNDPKNLGQRIAVVDLDLKKKINRELQGVEARVKEGAETAYKDWVKVKKDYRKGQLRTTVKIATKLTGIGFAAARLAGSAGADVLAWRSLLKDTFKLVEDLKGEMIGAEALRRQIVDHLDKVKVWHKALGDGKAAVASEVGLALLRTLVGSDAGRTLDSLSRDRALYDKKLTALKKNAQGLGKQVAKLQNKMNEAQGKVSADLAREFGPLNDALNNLIKKLIETNQKIGEGETWSGKMKDEIEELKRAKNATHLGTVVKTMDTISDVVTGALSWAKLAEESGKLATTIVKQANTLIKNIERWENERKQLMKAS